MALGIVLALLAGWVFRPREAVLIDDFRGPVRQVAIERAPLVQRFGDWVETARATESATLYDEDGQVTDIRRYRPNNTLDYRIEYSYDGENLTEEASYSANNLPLYKWVYAYEDDKLDTISGYNQTGVLDFRTLHRYLDDGRLASETSYNADSTLQYIAELEYDGAAYTRTTTYYLRGDVPDYVSVEVFDANDNRTEERASTPEGEPQYRVTYRYNEEGKLLEEAAFNAEDKLEYRLENRYDDAGNILETNEYDSDGEVFYSYSYAYDDAGNITERRSESVNGPQTLTRYEYAYDDEGNWTQRRTLKEVERFGENVLEPSEVTYRMISYYP